MGWFTNAAFSHLYHPRTLTCWEGRNPSAEEMLPENFILLGSFPIFSLTTERHTSSGGGEVAVRHVMAVATVFVTLVLGTA